MKIKKKNGFSMIELLVVLTIIGILATAGAVGFTASLSKGRDSRRKKDLNSLKVAFEDYYNDIGCYPADGVLENCGSEVLSPYVEKIPCDPLSKEPYIYVPEGCTGYRVHVALENERDPMIAKLSCDSDLGCGYDQAHNYGISAGLTVATDEAISASNGLGGE